MTTLYIATHNITGLKYFGKTDLYHTEEDLQKHYHGSGKYWLRHLNKHGDDVTMKIWYQDDCIPAVSALALMFSRTNNIVECNDWANLKEENGTSGGACPTSDETKKKLRKARLGTICISTRKKVLKYDLQGNILLCYLSIQGVELDGFDKEAVSKCCSKRLNKTHGGFIWRFKDDPLIEEESSKILF